MDRNGKIDAMDNEIEEMFMTFERGVSDKEIRDLVESCQIEELVAA